MKQSNTRTPDPGDRPDAEQLRRYLEATNAMGPHWRADGGALTFVWNETGAYQVYVVEAPESGAISPSGAAVRITGGPERCTDPRFLSTGEILYTSDIGGNENFQLMIAGQDDEGWHSRRLTTEDRAKYRLAHATDEELLFVGNDQDRARFTLYSQPLPVEAWQPRALFTPDAGVIQQAERLESTGRERGGETGRSGDGSLLVELAHSNTRQELLLLDHGEEAPRSLTRALDGGGDVRWDLIRPCPDGRLLVATDLDSDRFRPVLLGLDGSLTTIPVLEAMDQGEYEGSTYRPDQPGAVVELNIEGYSRLFHLTDCREDASLQEIEPPLHGALVSGDARTSRRGLALSPDARALAVAFGGPAEVANVWVGGFGGNTPDQAPKLRPHWQRVSHAEPAGIDPESLRDCSLARFRSFDGLSVPYFSYLPEGVGPFPTLLMIHGGPEAQARPTFNSVIQFLSAAGFAVVVPNIRGSAGYGRRYLDLDNRELRLDSIRDIAELARHLSESHEAVDGDRLAIMGGSYGGFAVLSAMTEHPELWKAGIDIVGISNFVTFLENTAAWRRGLRESEYGSLADRELLERISPITRIERVAAPLLIIQGDNDERVPLSESQQMYEKLRDLGRTVELMRFADEGHGITRLENRIRAYTRVVEWLREHV